MSEEADGRLLSELGNPKAEHLARRMARDLGHIRNTNSDREFEKLQIESKYAFRMMACSYAEDLGVDPHDDNGSEDQEDGEGGVDEE